MVNTKGPLTRSASRWMGASRACASTTVLRISATMHSLPGLTASTSKGESYARVPATTESPGPLGTGAASPVSRLSSTEATPRRTTPSTGTRSPGRTRTMSPGPTLAVPTSTSCTPSPRPSPRSSFERALAFSCSRVWAGSREDSDSRSTAAWARALASSVCPSRMKAKSITGSSRDVKSQPATPGATSEAAPKAKAESAPKPTRVFIEGYPRQSESSPSVTILRPGPRSDRAAREAPT
mmetsp:Transcript_17209/g.48436  ORF Transcript_17209/g.48436 Transcript_17209/m.48436 type:complete len:239 (+) Transcript_17209:1377-2093(+)